MMTKPIVFLRIRIFLLFAQEAAIPKKNNTGIVPRANESKLKPAVKKLPEAKAKTCMLWVKPQGRKKLSPPKIKGAKRCSDFFSFSHPAENFFGILTPKAPIEGKKPRIFNPSQRKTKA